jgi:hypothetical protein
MREEENVRWGKCPAGETSGEVSVKRSASKAGRGTRGQSFHGLILALFIFACVERNALACMRIYMSFLVKKYVHGGGFLLSLIDNKRMQCVKGS